MPGARALFAMLAAAGLLAFLASAPASAGGPVTVAVDDDFFAPTMLRVDYGTRVNFIWVGAGAHDVATNEDSPVFFNSGIKEGSGARFSYKFRQSGMYGIICTLHEEMTMDLRVRKKPPRL